MQEPQLADAIAQLFDAFTPPEGLKAAQLGMVESLRTAWQNDPGMSALENECVGLIDVMVKATTPLLDEYFVTELELRKKLFLEMYSKHFTRTQAMEAAAFYNTDVGQKLVNGVLGNFRLDNTLQAILEDPDLDAEIDADDMKRDQLAAGQLAAASLTAQEQAEIVRVFARADWRRALSAAAAEFQPASVELANSDFAPEIDARMDIVIEEAMTTHLQACGY